MDAHCSVERRTDLNVATFAGTDGSPDLFAAVGDRFVVMEDIPWSRMRELVDQYCDLHDAELRSFFLIPASSNPGDKWFRPNKGHKAASRFSPEALVIEDQDEPTPKKNSGIGQISGRYCLTTALRDAIELAGCTSTLSRDARYTAEWNVVLESFETQLKVAECLVDSDIRHLRWSLPRKRLETISSGQVENIANRHVDTLAFLNELCAPLLEWFSDPVRFGKKGQNTHGTIRPWALAWFAIWLCRAGLLLFPQTVLQRSYELFPKRMRPTAVAISTPPSLAASERDFVERLHKVVEHVSERAPERAELMLRSVDLTIPGLLVGRINADAIAHAMSYPALITNDKTTLGFIWSLEAARLKGAGVAPSRVQALTNRISGKRRPRVSAEDVPWAWIDGDYRQVAARDIYSPRDITVGPNLKAHAYELRALLPAILGKNESGRKGCLNIYLAFLATLPDQEVPASILDVTPRLIDSLTKKKEGVTLRGFLVAREFSPTRQAQVLAAVKNAWRVAAANRPDANAICPIIDQVRSAYGRGYYRASMTTRRAIDMEILELLIEENRRDDFAFSRTRTPDKATRLIDNRLVTDSETGIVASVWWPGVAVLLDLLLHVPMRHKQGRYLDSGEGDEFVVDLDTLAYVRNPLPTAAPGRQQGFITRVSLSPLRDEPGLGMYINTNKTGRDYAFPWLPVDIAENVRRLIAWQQRYNPITEPVPDRKVVLGSVDPSELVMVYPIFRDPAAHDFSPITHETTLKYFRSLLKHVEKKYNEANNTSFSFFRENGEAVYDIHSLRVTGVTRLLAMGVEAKVVRMLVGHASLAMTWYYEHITNQRVAASMQAALEQRRPSRENLLALSDEDRAAFFAKLFNRSDDPQTAKNLALLLVDEKSPYLDIRADGICPGQSCSDAGVWRTRACSLCKFNVTGVPFLAGMELVLNNLMAEVVLNQQRLAGLRDDLYSARLSGKPTGPLVAEVAKLEEMVDNLIQQWEAQFQYIKRAEGDLRDWLEGNAEEGQPLVALYSPDPGRLSVALKDSHHLMLFSALVDGATRVEGFSPAIGVREVRDEMLLEIARHEDKAALFFKLDPGARRNALDRFALMLLSRDPSMEDVESLIHGRQNLSDVGIELGPLLVQDRGAPVVAELDYE